ncbi:hypothetical protein HPP92_011495 [Vanilla planifolia]|uniref:Kinesin-like protein n=1 Tax=Vanilla planifolia TaxID=51239 RepID=A0A835R0T4_VANPL|nr:hypothetical protein HPP92_011495 [Vanilla planifolia]
MKAILHARTGRAPSSETLTPSSHKQRPPRIPKENVEPNCLVPESSLFRSPPVSAKSPTVRNRSPLPPRPPPSSNPLKRKLNLETQPENGSPAALPCDSGVQVIVRVRPLNRKEVEEGNQIALKISHNSISILDHTFTFDSVADASSRQQDIFQLVGVPLVENCLAGFNSSIFAYGQTGSGKTYTMWGPCSALTADGSLSNESGLTPRVFELLFSRINEEQSKNSEKQLSYQCRCSFLEIYNEQITDLLDPAQRNLQIREDVRAGVYVDCLSEEYIYQMKDAIHLLVKGLSNRRTGATSINAESSRSHCVFTCVVECRSKSMDDGVSSLRTSRINFVDLAGSERQKATCAVGERLKEAGNINRSLSQLGNLINILAEVSQSGKHRHIPYRDSRLTFLLQDSLGGNAKLAMICAISPSQSCKTETFSTLRFAQRAKAIKNQAVVNETREDDVNFLREQIRQLKDELLRMKSRGPSPDSNGGSTTWNVQRSLNLLRLSLCRPRTLPVVEDDSDEEMEIVEEGVERTCGEVPSSTNEENKNNANEELSTLKSLKELTPDHFDSAIPNDDMCPMEVVEQTCVEVPTTADDHNRKNSNKEPSILKSLKELSRESPDREAVHSDTCPMEVHGSGIMIDQHDGLRIISIKGSEAEETAIEKCRKNSQCGEAEMSVIQVSSIPNMNEKISQEACKQKMMHSMAKPFDDLGREIFLEESAVSGSSAGADIPDQHDGIIQEGFKQEMVLDRAESTDGRVPEEADVSRSI